jgi:hypothetical protein
LKSSSIMSLDMPRLALARTMNSPYRSST